jgi:hypothetical protein
MMQANFINSCVSLVFGLLRIRGSRVVFLSGFVAILALSGCFKPQGRGVEAQNERLADEKGEIKPATFFLGEVSGTSEIANLHAGFSIPESKLFNFKTCVQDKRTQDVIKGHKFVIGGGESEQVATSDTDGCLSWAERIRFNFLGDEFYLPVRRTITAEGIHSGVREIRLAINPWSLSNGANAVVDLSRKIVAEKSLALEEKASVLLTGLSSDGKSATRPLWLESLSVDNEPLVSSQSTLQRRLRLRFVPSILHADVYQQRVVIPLSQARLGARAALVEIVTVAGRETRKLVWWNASQVAVSRSEELFTASFDVVLPTGNAGSRFQLLLRVVPLGGPEGLEAFEGLYDIGGFGDLTGLRSLKGQLRSSNSQGGFSFAEESKTLGNSGSTFGVLDEKPPGSHSNSHSHSHSNSHSVNHESGSISNKVLPEGSHESSTGVSLPESDFPKVLPSGVSRVKAFEVGILRVSLLGLDENETSTRRALRYAVTTCVTDVANGGRPAIDVNFKVLLASGKTIDVRGMREPGLEGCIRWEDKIAHRYYEPERFLLQPIAIRHESGFEEKRTLALNPWDRFGFGRDLKEDPSFVESVNRRVSLRSRLLVDFFSFDSVDTRDYHVDSFMNLSIIKRVRLRIPLRVQRHSSVFSGRSLPAEPLRDGVYLLKSALYLEAKDASGRVVQVIAPMREKRLLVRVRGGELKADVEFSLADPRLLRARTNFVFEILPIDESQLSADEIRQLRIERPGLESLIDHDSGLETPTFVGPLWIRDESGGAVVLASDDLGVRGDTSQTSYHASSAHPKMVRLDSEHQQAMRSLARVTVDQLLEKASSSDRLYRERMSAESQLSEFLAKGNLDYVSLAYDGKKLEHDIEVGTSNRALPQSGGLPYLINVLNMPIGSDMGFRFADVARAARASGPVTAETLRSLIEGRSELDAHVSVRLCYLLLSDMPRRMSPDGAFTFGGHVPHQLAEDCAVALQMRGIDQVIGIERKIRIVEIGSQSFISGRQLGFSVGADVSFGRSESHGWSFGWSPLKLIESAGRVVPGLNLVTAAPGALGLSFSLNKGASTSISEGSAFGSGINLNMEQVEMKLGLKRYESCAVIRMKPDWLETRKSRLAFLNPKISRADAARIISRGLMICNGEESTEPLEVRERYYSFAQMPMDETQLDRGDLKNHPWLASLRGRRDYATFLYFLEAKKSSSLNVREEIRVGGLPLDRLEEAYQGFRSQMPSLPGFYTRESNERAGSNK